MYAMKSPHSEAAPTGGATPSSIRPARSQPAAGHCAYGSVSFEIPHQGNVEGIMLAFRTPSGAAMPAASVSITRERMREGDTLRKHTDRALSRIGREAENFDLLDSGTLDVGGRPAQKLHFSWTSHLGRMDQTMVLVDPGEERERGVLALNVVGPLELAEETAKVFEELLATIRFDARHDAPETRSEHATPLPDASRSAGARAAAPPLSPPAPPPPLRGAEHVPSPVIPMPGYRDR